jgi:TPR repeat protein
VREIFQIALIMAALAAGLLPRVAGADFYTLDGKFACLESDDTACTNGNHAADMIEPPSGKPTESKRSPSAADHDPVLKAPPTLARDRREQNASSQDPLVEIAARIEAGKPSSEDLKHLHTLSRSGDGRAIELLAWCDYFGIGLPRDPVAAYIMYGIAALAGVAGADANRAVIYEYVLTPDQRQLVLDIQNDDIE